MVWPVGLGRADGVDHRRPLRPSSRESLAAAGLRGGMLELALVPPRTFPGLDPGPARDVLVVGLATLTFVLALLLVLFCLL